MCFGVIAQKERAWFAHLSLQMEVTNIFFTSFSFFTPLVLHLAKVNVTIVSMRQDPTEVVKAVQILQDGTLTRALARRFAVSQHRTRLHSFVLEILGPIFSPMLVRWVLGSSWCTILPYLMLWEYAGSSVVQIATEISILPVPEMYVLESNVILKYRYFRDFR